MNGGQEKHAVPKAPRGKGNELIREKKQLQLELKDLNRRVKELKQLLRGGRIDEPLDPALPGLAEKIVQDMGQAANEVKEIAKDQAEYAAKHQGRSPRPVEPPVADIPPAPAEPKLEFPAELLQSAASSRWSRFMTYMKTPFQVGDEDRWERLKLLRTAADINNTLKDIENSVLSSDEIAVPSAVYQAAALYHVIDDSVVNRLLAKLGEEPKVEEKEGEEPSSPGEEIPSVVPAPAIGPDLTRQEQDVINALRVQVRQNLEGWPDRRYGYLAKLIDVEARLGNLSLRYGFEVPEDLREEISIIKTKEIPLVKKTLMNPIATYNDIKSQDDSLRARIDRVVARAKGFAETHGIPWEQTLIGSAQPEPEPIDVESMSATEALEKLAQSVLDRKLTHNVLTRYLKRKWVGIFGGPTRGLRLSAAQSSREAREKLDKFMDVLEQPSSFKMMADSFVPFLSAFARLLPKLMRLGDEHNKYARLERAQQRMKGKRITIDPIQKMELNQLGQMMGKIVDDKPVGPGLYQMIARLRSAIASAPRRRPVQKTEEEQEQEEEAA